jgi:signal transduction histidine kinase
VDDDAPRLVLPQLQLDDLLEELQHRLTDVRATRDRTRALLEAVLAIGGDLDLQTVLHRIAQAASTLADAQYAALGVIGEGGGLSQFITVGVDDEARERIGSLPRGHGVLGLLIRDPRPRRLDDIGKDPSAYGFPPQHPPMTTFLGVPIRVREEVFGNLYLTEKRGGSAFDEQDEAVVLALATAAGVAIENARLYDAARRREGWMRASAQISASLLGGSEPEEVLHLVAGTARQLSGADTAFIALPAGGGRLLVEVVDGADAEQLRGTTLSMADSPCGRVLAGGEPVLLLGDQAGDVLAKERAESAVITPLADRGVLVVTTGAGTLPLSTAVVTELTGFAAQATLGLEVAERRRDAERLVVFEDRDRIARDLHDLVIQRLFATGMQLESAARLIERPDAASRVRRSVDDLDTTIREIRSTIYALQNDPSEQDRSSLRSRLFEVVDAGAEQLGFAPSVRLSGLVDTSVPPGLADHLLAVLREALSNAARHAGAARVEVVLEVDDAVCLVVRDDGCGLPEQGRRSGLANLAERAVAVGGTFRAGPGQSGGTELVWSAPVSAG